MKQPVMTVGKAEEGSLYLLLFLLPFSKAAVEISFGLLLGGWVLARMRRSTRFDSVWLRPRLVPLSAALGAYLAVCALSILVSDHPALSASGFVNKWLEYLLFLVIAADLGVRPGVMRRSLGVMACSSLFVMAEGVSQELFGRGFIRGYAIGPLGGKYMRMIGPYENPIDLATYLMVVVLMLFPVAVNDRSALRWPLRALLIALLLCLARTEAFGAWLGFGAGLLTLLAFQKSLHRAGLLLAAGLTVSGAGFLYWTGHLGPLFSPIGIGKDDRQFMWQAAIRMIQDRPVLGHGLNTFMANYLTYWVGGERQPRYAHNCYLQVAAETGVVGLCAFLVLLGSLCARLFAGLRRACGDERAQLVGLLGGLVAFAVQAGVDTNFYSLRQAALFWVLAGLAVGLSERLTGTAS